MIISIQQGFCYANILEKIVQNKGSLGFLCSQAMKDPWRIVFQYWKATRHSAALLREPCSDELRLLLATSTTPPATESPWKRILQPQWNPQMISFLATILWRAWSQSHPKSYSQISDPQKWWRKKYCFFNKNPLSFEMICYTVRHSQYRFLCLKMVCYPNKSLKMLTVALGWGSRENLEAPKESFRENVECLVEILRQIPTTLRLLGGLTRKWENAAG